MVLDTAPLVSPLSCPLDPPCRFLVLPARCSCSLHRHAQLALFPALLGSAAALGFPFYTLFMGDSSAAADALDDLSDFFFCACLWFDIAAAREEQSWFCSSQPEPWHGVLVWLLRCTLNQIDELMLF